MYYSRALLTQFDIIITQETRHNYNIRRLGVDDYRLVQLEADRRLDELSTEEQFGEYV